MTRVIEEKFIFFFYLGNIKDNWTSCAEAVGGVLLIRSLRFTFLLCVVFRSILNNLSRHPVTQLSPSSSWFSCLQIKTIDTRKDKKTKNHLTTFYLIHFALSMADTPPPPSLVQTIITNEEGQPLRPVIIRPPTTPPRPLPSWRQRTLDNFFVA